MAGGAFQSIAHGNFVVVDPPHERPLRQDLLDELLGIVSARRHFFRPGVEPEREPNICALLSTRPVSLWFRRS
jgi:hypothetical protein